MSAIIDYDSINRIALNRFEDLLRQFIPGGKRVNGEYVARNPRRNDKSSGSFSVNIHEGVWKDFATGDGGADPVSLWAFLFNCQHQSDAARILAGHLGVPELAADNDNRPGSSVKQDWSPLLPVPADAGNPPDVKWQLDESTGEWMKHPIVARWAYHDATGKLLGYAARVSLPDGSKDVVPQTYCRGEDGTCKWKVKSFPKPRPLYNLHKLAANPAAPVIIVEGEKTADAGTKLLQPAVTVTWPGGGNAVDFVDLEPLNGRAVAIWPDNDEPGYKAAVRMAKRLQGFAARVVIVMPPAFADDGWDIADEAPEDWKATEHLKAHAMAPDLFAKAAGLEESQDEPPAHMDEAPPAEPDDMPAPREARQKPAAISQQFGQPIDLFGIQHPPQLPIDVLPDVMRNYVEDQSALLGSDHSVIGMTALVAAAACITDGIKLQPKRHDPTWRESARLWVAVVGDPSTRKSPAIDKAVRHVKRIDHDMVESSAQEQSAYQRQADEIKELNKEAKKKGGDPLPFPQQPPKKRLMVEDTTVEALSEVLRDNPRGVLCLKDELTGWFASMDAYKGGTKGASMDRAHWLEAYNGGRRSIDRVTRGSINIPNWSVCMIGGIQEEMIRRVASTMGHDGLLQRFMVVCARPAVKDMDRVPDMDAMDEYRQLFDRLVQLGPSDEPVRMSEYAHQSRERVSDYARKMVAAFDHPHMQAWLGKWDGLFARLALLYHVIECMKWNVYPTTSEVSAESAARVERLMCGFLLHHAIHFYSEILDANDAMQHTRQLARLILAKRMEIITKRDMATLWKASRKLEDWELRKIVNTLANYDWLMPDTSLLDTDGKPRVWYVNPAVHEVFAGHAEREAARRIEVANTIRELKTMYARDPDDPDSY